MLTVLDTNALIRFFTNDVPQKAIKVKKLLEEEKYITISDVVFPALEYVLMGEYDVSKEDLLKIFQFLFSQKNIILSAHLKKALLLFETTNFDMADCVIAANALEGTLASFDKEFLRLSGMRSFWK